MGKIKNIVSAFMPSYPAPVLKEPEWQEIRCSECDRMIGERSSSMKGAIRLKCRRCGKLTTVIVL